MVDLGEILVTGADGFIGSHLVESLVEKGEKVTALCCYNSFGSFGWLQKISQEQSSNLKLILGDIRDSGFVEEAVLNKDTIFHLASLIAIPYSYHAPQSYFDTNTIGALNIAKASLKNKVKRVIHTSTSEVYGSARYTPIDEKHPLQGQSPYSASKISADFVMESYYRSFDLPIRTLRPFNTYGPRQSLRAVIPSIISQIYSSEESVFLGSLDPLRDFTYVEDTVNAFIELARGPESTCGEIYNSGTGVSISIGNLVQSIMNISGIKKNVDTDTIRLRPEKSEVNKLECDFSKIREAVNWEPKVDLNKGLESTLNWFKDQGKLLSDNGRYVI
ncbi:MAG: GDP-mannose 4,6-dehydratase [Oligoflexales bacterium]